MPPKYYIESEIEYNYMINYLQNNQIPEGLNADKIRRFKSKTSGFYLLNSQLYYGDDKEKKVVIHCQNIDMINQAIKKFHFPGHAGVKNTFKMLSAEFHGIKRTSVELFIKNCEICALHVPLKSNDIVRNIIANHVWERIQIDCIDLRKYSDFNDGYCWILNVIDVYSKYSFTYPMKAKTAVLVRKFFLFIR